MSGGIECPWCGSSKTRVIDSRPESRRGMVRRRRECKGCTARWTTYEVDADRLDLLEDSIRKRSDPLDSG